MSQNKSKLGDSCFTSSDTVTIFSLQHFKITEILLGVANMENTGKCKHKIPVIF